MLKMENKFKCKQCEREFIDNNSNFNRIFCSNKCKYKGMGYKISQSIMGHSVSIDARKKISLAFKGKTYEEIMGKKKAKLMRNIRHNKFIGKGNPFYNKTHSEETKERMSLLKLDKTHEEIMGKENAEKWHDKMSGVNSPMWKGGYSIKDYKNFTNRFKNLVRKRDNQICMLCGNHREKMNTALSIHHIDYNKHNSMPENCISLCFDCHAKTNYNRKYWINHFQSLMHDRYNYEYSEKDEVIIQYA
jgi:hypothetical protein